MQYYENYIHISSICYICHHRHSKLLVFKLHDDIMIYYQFIDLFFMLCTDSSSINSV